MSKDKQRLDFQRCLKKHGFTKMDTKGWIDPKQNCWYNKEKDWFADILDHNNFYDVWMTGKGLPSSSFPGGKIYHSVEEIDKVLNNKQDGK